MTCNDTCLTRPKNQYPEIFKDGVLVIRENILNQQAVIEEEEKAGKKSDEDNRIRNQVLLDVVEKNEVGDRNQSHVEDHHVENTAAILNTCVPDYSLVAVGQEDGKQAKPCIEYCSFQIMVST